MELKLFISILIGLYKTVFSLWNYYILMPLHAQLNSSNVHLTFTLSYLFCILVN